MPPPHPNKISSCVIMYVVYKTTSKICRFLAIPVFAKTFSSKKVVARLSEHDDVITPLLRGGPRLSLALGLALARAGPAEQSQSLSRVNLQWPGMKQRSSALK